MSGARPPLSAREGPASARLEVGPAEAASDIVPTEQPGGADHLQFGSGVPGTATLESVGALAGVSRSTVSRVINGSPNVSPKTLEAVMNAIRQLGYVPNQAAKSLAQRRTSIVTALIPEDMDRVFGDPFFAAIISGIEDHLSDTSLALNLMIASEKTFPKVLSTLAGGMSDGLLVLSHHATHELVEALETRVPVVYGGRPLHRSDHRTYVDVDNVEAGRIATQHLVDKGCKRIGMITGPRDMPSTRDRLRGFEEVTAEVGTAGPIVTSDYTVRGGAEATREIMGLDPSIDGLFVANDLMARATVSVLGGMGRNVPEDVAVVGFDDSPAATSVSPMLTTVRQDPYQQGMVMARLLQRLLEEPSTPPSVVVLPTELIERETT